MFIESLGRAVTDRPYSRTPGIALIPSDPELPAPRSVLPQSDGQFIMTGVAPGNYVLELYWPPEDLY